MNILAIDTATERCSVAISRAGVITETSSDTPRGHADLVLPMIESLLAQAQLSLREIDGIAYGRGPGAFTGVRIAIGVVQGLAFGAQKRTVGVSNLAAVAQQAAHAGDRILVCMDARMGEVYWGLFSRDAHSGLVTGISDEQVSPPDQVIAQLAETQGITVIAGTGVLAYPPLAAAFSQAAQFPALLPRAREIAQLGLGEFELGHGLSAAEAQPVYLRNQVAVAKKKA